MEENKEVKKFMDEMDIDAIDEDIEGFDGKDFDDVIDEVKNAVEDVKNGIKNAYDSLKEKVSNVDLSKEAVNGYADEFKTLVNSYITKANDVVKNFKEDEKTVEYWSKAKTVYVSVTDKVVDGVRSAYNKAMENDNFKKTVETVADKVKVVSEKASEKYNDFTHDPKVRKVVVTSKEAVVNAFNSIKEKVKTALKKEEKVEEENKEEE